jgi:SPP1 family predicted phage head-tail adaptor
MDRRITLRYPVNARGADGSVVPEWIEVVTLWAQWLPASSREFMAAQARNSETTGILRIRHRIDVAADWRVVKGDDLFKLTGDPLEVGRREYLDLPVASLNQSPGAALSVRMLHDGTPRLLHDGGMELLHNAA